MRQGISSPPQRLEPCAGQLARTVLRGGDRSNAISLPDPVREPCPPKCCYPDMRRSNLTCEAPRTTATIWEHQSGGGLAEDGRLNASERPLSRSVIENRPKVLTGRSQNGMRVGSSNGTLDDGGTRTRRTIGRSRPIRLSTLDNRVSPTRPVATRRRYPDRKGGDGGGGRGAAKQAKAAL